MTQNEKELLLKDLCSRLPHGVKFEHTDKHTLCEILSITPIYDYENVIYFNDYINHPKKCNIDDVKPYLFPLSSMTEEQRKEWQSLMIHDSYGILYPTIKSFDYLYKNHIDINDLIPMGLAIDATNKNIY